MSEGHGFWAQEPVPNLRSQAVRWGHSRHTRADSVTGAGFAVTTFRERLWAGEIRQTRPDRYEVLHVKCPKSEPKSSTVVRKISPPSRSLTTCNRALALFILKLVPERSNHHMQQASLTSHLPSHLCRTELWGPQTSLEISSSSVSLTRLTSICLPTSWLLSLCFIFP